MGILQAGILEWVAMFSSRGSSQSKTWTQVFHIAGRFFTDWATREYIDETKPEATKPEAIAYKYSDVQ